MGIDPRHIVEIPNGVPAPVSPRATVPGAVPTIAFLGLLGPRKGTDVLIEALAALNQRGVKFHAIIAGNGEVDQTKSQAKA